MSFDIIAGISACIRFTKTIKTSLGVSSALIVSKDSATLGYPNEESVLLNANHRKHLQV